MPATAVAEATATAVTGTTIPVLPALDIDETLRFYARLGFELAARYRKGELGQDYAIIRRGTMELHFWGCDDWRVLDYTGGCYVRVGDAGALHEAFRARGVKPLSPLEEKPWKSREFHVIDPSNNVVRFGQSL
jgi:catechol 2,3-dioxygenase-like lactoylglutathione lyase family enzyme